MMRKFTIIIVFLMGTISLNAQSVLTEDFEGTGMPSGWTIETQATDGGWLFGTATMLSSQYFPIPDHTKIAATNDDECNCNKMTDRLITPSVDLSSYSGVMLSFDAFFVEGTYNNFTETAKIEASIDGGTTWSVVQQLAGVPDWVNIIVDVSAYVGNANVKFAFTYSDQGDWLYGWAIDNVDIYAPQMYDMTTESITTSPFLGMNNAPFDIKGTIKNLGSATITTFDLNYKIDNGTTVTTTITGVSIAPLDVYTFTHPTQWNPAGPAIYDVTAWASNLNGNPDENPGNDEFTKAIEVFANWIEKKLLHEVFTASTCPPCLPGNIAIQAVTDAAGNQGKWTMVKYQMNWPGAGDPYYNADGETRKSYYNVTAVPDMELNGGWNDNPNSYNQGVFDQFYNVPAFMNIEAVHTLDIPGESIEIQVKITPHQDFPAGLKLHIVVVENMTTGNVGTNGETEFYFVEMKMIPDGNGTDVGPFTSGNQVIFNKTASLAGTFIEEMTDLSVVVFVQTNTTKEVHQSAWSIEGTIGIEENEEIITGIYPNPASTSTMLNYELKSNSDVTLDIYSVTGELVYSSDMGNQAAGEHKVEINTSNLANGVYTLQLRTDDRSFVKKLVISK